MTTTNEEISPRRTTRARKGNVRYGDVSQQDKPASAATEIIPDNDKDERDVPSKTTPARKRKGGEIHAVVDTSTSSEDEEDDDDDTFDLRQSAPQPKSRKRAKGDLSKKRGGPPKNTSSAGKHQQKRSAKRKEPATPWGDLPGPGTPTKSKKGTKDGTQAEALAREDQDCAYFSEASEQDRDIRPLQAILSGDVDHERGLASLLSLHAANPALALRQLIHLTLILAGGNVIFLTEDQVRDREAIPTTLRAAQAAILAHIEAGTINGGYPLLSKGKDGKVLRRRVSLLIREFVSAIQSNGRSEEEEDESEDTGPGNTFIHLLSEWIIPISALQYRPLRHAGMMIANHVLQALSTSGQEMTEDVEIKERQAVGWFNARTQTRESLEEVTEAILTERASCHDLMTDYIDGMLIPRTRDIYITIRTDCMRAWSDLFKAYPTFYNDDQYLIYLEKGISDESSLVRVEAARAISSILEVAGREVRERFKGIILGVLMREEEDQEEATIIVSLLHGARSIQEEDGWGEEDLTGISRLILSAAPEVRTAVAPLTAHLLSTHYEGEGWVEGMGRYWVEVAEVAGEGWEGMRVGPATEALLPHLPLLWGWRDVVDYLIQESSIPDLTYEAYIAMLSTTIRFVAQGYAGATSSSKTRALGRPKRAGPGSGTTSIEQAIKGRKELGSYLLGDQGRMLRLLQKRGPRAGGICVLEAMVVGTGWMWWSEENDEQATLAILTEIFRGMQADGELEEDVTVMDTYARCLAHLLAPPKHGAEGGAVEDGERDEEQEEGETERGRWIREPVRQRLEEWMGRHLGVGGEHGGWGRDQQGRRAFQWMAAFMRHMDLEGMVKVEYIWTTLLDGLGHPGALGDEKETISALGLILLRPLRALERGIVGEEVRVLGEWLDQAMAQLIVILGGDGPRAVRCEAWQMLGHVTLLRVGGKVQEDVMYADHLYLRDGLDLEYGRVCGEYLKVDLTATAGEIEGMRKEKDHVEADRIKLEHASTMSAAMGCRLANIGVVRAMDIAVPILAQYGRCGEAFDGVCRSMIQEMGQWKEGGDGEALADLLSLLLIIVLDRGEKWGVGGKMPIIRPLCQALRFSPPRVAERVQRALIRAAMGKAAAFTRIGREAHGRGEVGRWISGVMVPLASKAVMSRDEATSLVQFMEREGPPPKGSAVQGYLKKLEIIISGGGRGDVTERAGIPRRPSVRVEEEEEENQDMLLPMSTPTRALRALELTDGQDIGQDRMDVDVAEEEEEDDSLKNRPMVEMVYTSDEDDIFERENVA